MTYQSNFTFTLDSRAFQELKIKMLKIKEYKEELSSALGEFLEEHFPLPEEDGSAKKKKVRVFFLIIKSNGLTFI